jgi:hypothetical protein
MKDSEGIDFSDGPSRVEQAAEFFFGLGEELKNEYRGLPSSSLGEFREELAAHLWAAPRTQKRPVRLNGGDSSGETAFGFGAWAFLVGIVDEYRQGVGRCALRRNSDPGGYSFAPRGEFQSLAKRQRARGERERESAKPFGLSRVGKGESPSGHRAER